MHNEQPLSPQLEIETYTWDVLPDELKTGDIVDYVCREIEWVRGSSSVTRAHIGSASATTRTDHRQHAAWPRGLPVANWVQEAAEAHGGFEVSRLDLAEIDLPMFDEPKHPRLGDYVHQHTKDWSAQVAACDAFVVVHPEYNNGFNAAIKNAIDYLSAEWHHKADRLVELRRPRRRRPSGRRAQDGVRDPARAGRREHPHPVGVPADRGRRVHAQRQHARRADRDGRRAAALTRRRWRRCARADPLQRKTAARRPPS